MDDHGETIARIDERTKFLCEWAEESKQSHAGISQITQKNSIAIAVLRTRVKVIFAIAGALGLGIISLAVALASK